MTYQVEKDFVPSNFVWDEIAHALGQCGNNIHPWVALEVKGLPKETPEGFIRWTLSVRESHDTGVSSHRDWSETGDRPFEMEVLQQEACPFAVRITIKGNRMSIASS